ncbi:hypothetical protein F2P56_028849 [Juglans regia]|uniref:Serine carboxypeptidase-like 18 n=1 Tax=Juglans regia TaxID=51240 RepID=A0A833WXQ9_JUGRE|nr:hypothetical protein F2P56_028849 [Juglans regia]
MNSSSSSITQITMWWPSVVVVLLLQISNLVASQSVINTLPGFTGELPFKLETGYIGVGELDKVQLFYYFIESERSPKDDPLVLWLTGGPGCSGLSGLLFEIGPFTFDYANSSGNKPTLELNPYSWTKIANIIFLDAPVDTGFSYATTWEAYDSNDTSSRTQTYEFLRKWLMAHPTFLFNLLYIAGDSYSGKTIPIIVQEVSNGNKIGHWPPLNLKSTKRNCQGRSIDPDPNNTQCVEDLRKVNECLDDIYRSQILEPDCAAFSPKPNKLWSLSLHLDDNFIDILHSAPDQVLYLSSTMQILVGTNQHWN